VLEWEPQDIPVEIPHLLVMFGAGADPHQALDEIVHGSPLFAVFFRPSGYQPGATRG
jgi:hypothetical protein